MTPLQGGMMPSQVKPFRLNHSEILALALTRSSRDSESIEISRNAKGEFQFSVTARTTEGETLSEAFERASATAGMLVARFPYQNGSES